MENNGKRIAPESPYRKVNDNNCKMFLGFAWIIAIFTSCIVHFVLNKR